MDLQMGSNQRAGLQRSLVDFLEQIVVGEQPGESQAISVVSPNPFCRDRPKFPSQGGNIPMLELFRQAQELKGSNEIVGPEDDFHVSGIGQETPGRNSGQCVGVFEFSKQEFLKSSIAIESPDVVRFQIEGVHEDAVVGVVLKREETGLDSFRFQGGRPSHRHKPMRGFPMEGRIQKFGGFPSFRKFVVSSSNHDSFQRRRHLGHYTIADPRSFERENEVFVVKCAVESNAGSGGGNRRRQFFQHLFEEKPRPRTGMNIAGQKVHAQRKTHASLAGDNRRIRRFSAVLAIESHRRSFLSAKHGQGGGVGVDNCAVLQPQCRKQPVSELVVGDLQTSEMFGSKPMQEISQRFPMREYRQAQERRQKAVGNERLGIFDSSDACDDRIDMREKNVGGMKLEVVVARPTNIGLKESPQSNRFAKCLKKYESAISCQTVSIEGKYELSESFWHPAQTYLKSRFVQSPVLERK